MLYAAIFNFAAGSVSGSLFRIYGLLLLFGFVLIEFALVATVRGNFAWGWAILNVADVQFGYFAGICARGALEHLGYSVPGARPERLR